MTTEFLPSGTFVGRLLPGLIEEARCTELIAQLTQRGFVPTGERYPAAYRNNDRLVFDDAGLATELAARLTGSLPEALVEQGARWRLVGLNARFRACRYEHGQAFCVHRDGAYVPEPERRSFLTVQVYLDDDPGRTGGRTRFYADPQGRELLASITPGRGSVIVFDHRVWHDGEAVTGGIKHVLRTDAIYQRVEGAPVAEEPDVIGRHRGYAWAVIGCRDGTIASSGRDGVVRRWPGVETDLRSGSVTTISEAADLRVWCGTRAGMIVTLAEAAKPVDEGLGAVLDSAGAGSLVAFSTARGELRAYHAGRRALVWSRQAHDGWAWSVTPHRGAFVSCGHDGRVQSIDLQGSARTLATLDVPLRVIASAGERLEAGDERGWIHTLGVDGVVLASRRAHAGPITALAHTAGSLFSAGEDGVVKQWRGAQMTVVRQLRDYVTSLAVVGGALIVAGYDGAIRRIAI